MLAAHPRQASEPVRYLIYRMVTFLAVCTTFVRTEAPTVELRRGIRAGELIFAGDGIRVTTVATFCGFLVGTLVWRTGFLFMSLRFSLALIMTMAMPAIGQPGGRYANLGVENSVDIVMPDPGTPVEFTIEITNYGDYLAENVIIQDLVEPPLRIPEGRAASPGSGYYDPETGVWTIGDLRVGESAILVIPAIIENDNQKGCVVNTAQFEHQQDLTPTNNRASMAVRLDEELDCADVSTGLSLTPGQNEYISVGSEPCDRERPYSGAVQLINRGADVARGIEIQLVQEPVIAPNLRFSHEQCEGDPKGTCRIESMAPEEVLRLPFISDDFRNTQPKEQRFSVKVTTLSEDYDATNDNRQLDITISDFSNCKDNDNPYNLPEGVVPGGGGGGGCFIATAAHGSYLHPKVRVLRDWRDQVLLTTGPGRWFVRQYYRYSPPVADFIAERDWLKALVRLMLLPLILLVSSPIAVIVALLTSLAVIVAVLFRLRTST